MNYKTAFYLCLFGGFLGLHKFYQRDYKKGLLYLFTIGLFMFGWLTDCIRLLPEAYPTEKKLEKRKQKEQVIKREQERIAQLDRERIAYCPRCKSTTIQYVERRKQLSIGRAIIGWIIAIPAAIIGALTSKRYKGFVKCLKCGHIWKI